MLAVALMAVVCTVTYLSFSIVSTAWKKGMALSDDLHHGDFAIEQLVMGLRSAYFPSGKTGGDPAYGFQMKDSGSGENSRDRISWVKLGGSLVGADCPFAGSPHRVEFTVDEDHDGESSAMVRAWQLQGQAEDFDPDKVTPSFLSRNITGFNCRAAYEKVNDEIDWLEDWEETNRLPVFVEVTLYLKPLDSGEKPVEIKRVMTIPVSPLSWKK